MYYKNEQSMLFESLDVELWIESEVKWNESHSVVCDSLQPDGL